MGLLVAIAVLSTGAAGNAQWLFETNGTSFTITRYRGFSEDVVIPETISDRPVTSIGSWAFQNCVSMTNLTIPDSVTRIGARAFTGCAGLRNLTIPNSVTNVAPYAFGDCTGLTNVVIGSRVIGLGEGAFSRLHPVFRA